MFLEACNKVEYTVKAGEGTSLATSASSRTQRMRVPNTRGDTRMAILSSAAASMRPAGASLASAAITTTCVNRVG